MFQLAASASVTGTPSFGPSGTRADCAAAHETQPSAMKLTSSARAAARSDVNIADLSRFAHFPALNRVVVISIVRAARGDQRGTRRLHGAAVVDRAAHQHARATAPAPRRPKPYERFREHGLGERRLRPCLAAVRRHVDAPDLAEPRPCDAG